MKINATFVLNRENNKYLCYVLICFSKCIQLEKFLKIIYLFIKNMFN